MKISISYALHGFATGCCISLAMFNLGIMLDKGLNIPAVMGAGIALIVSALMIASYIKAGCQV